MWCAMVSSAAAPCPCPWCTGSTTSTSAALAGSRGFGGTYEIGAAGVLAAPHTQEAAARPSVAADTLARHPWPVSPSLLLLIALLSVFLAVTVGSVSLASVLSSVLWLCSLSV